MRATAWAVVDIAETCEPEELVVENVPEFCQWELYPVWRTALEKLGYKLTENQLDSADFGVPQHRIRFFLVGSKTRVVPKIQPPMVRAPSVGEIIDWDSKGWSPTHKLGRAAPTLARVEAGRKQFGERFVFSYYGNTKTGRSIDRPVGTITTRDRWAVVRGDAMRMLTVDEQRKALSFPEGYRLLGNRNDQVKMLGNAVPPLMAQGVLEQIG